MKKLSGEEQGDAEFALYNKILDHCDPKMGGEMNAADVVMTCLIVVATITEIGDESERARVLELVPDVLRETWSVMGKDETRGLGINTRGGDA